MNWSSESYYVSSTAAAYVGYVGEGVVFDFMTTSKSSSQLS